MPILDPLTLAAIQQEYNSPTNQVIRANEAVEPSPQLVDPFAEQAPPAEADLGFLGMGAPSPGSAPLSSSASVSGAQKTGGSMAASQSSSGYDPAKNALIANGPAKTYQQKVDRGNAQVEQTYDPFRQSVDNIASQQSAAVDAETGILQDKMEEDIANKRYLADIQANYTHKAEAAFAGAQLASQEAFNRYKLAQADFAAQQVRPNALFEDNSGVNNFGIGIAAFVHDFLGAKGIKTSAMDTLNGALKRNIDAQVNNIKHKGDVAAMFKDQWEMQRAMSSSDAEARARMHGLGLKSAEMSIDAEMAKYDSKLAGAKAMAAKALIQKEQLKNDLEIQQHISQDKNTQAQREATVYGHELSASASKYASYASLQAHREDRAAAKEARSDAAKAKADEDARKKAVDAHRRVVFDPETQKGQWKLKDGSTDKEIEKVKDTVAEFEPAYKDIELLRGIARKHKASIDGIAGTRFDDQDKRLYAAVSVRLAHNYLAALGERATDKDVEQMLKGLPNETMLTNGGVERILARTQASLHGGVRAKLRQYVDDVEPDAQETSQQNLPAAGALIDAETVASGKDKPADGKSPDDPVEHALYRFHKSGAFTAADESDYKENFPDSDTKQIELKNNWKEFNSDPYFGAQHRISVNQGEGTGRSRGAFDDKPKWDEPDSAFVQMYKLAELAKAGDPKAAQEFNRWAHKNEQRFDDPDLTSDQERMLADYALWNTYRIAK